MKRPNPAQIDIARTLFAQESNGAESADQLTAAAGRLHQKIVACLAPLLGASGARALLARSVKLTAPDFPRLRGVHFDAEPGDDLAQPLIMCLRGEAPAAIVETTVALCASLLALLATLMGDRLTFQVLRGAWPSLDAIVLTEESKS